MKVKGGIEGEVDRVHRILVVLSIVSHLSSLASSRHVPQLFAALLLLFCCIYCFLHLSSVNAIMR